MAPRKSAWWDTLVALLLSALSAAAALRWCLDRGYTLYYGDAQAHLNIARRLWDSRTPGFDQLGTVWLPLPHLLDSLLVGDDRLWRTGLAGAIPSAVCYTLAVTFLFAAVKTVFESRAAGFAAAAALALNPNLLYLQSTPMTEPVFLACWMGALYCTVRFGRTQSLLAPAAAGIAACAGSLTRYEGWFLIPFLAVYFLIAAKRRRIAATAIFLGIAITGPLAWLAHNAWYMGDPLAFYRGEYGPRAIQAGKSYPGDHDWTAAWLQFRVAAQLILGPVLVWTGLAGIAGALAKRALWPLLLLALPPAFYIWSVHSGATPIFVPSLKPFSYYNVRYGLAALPLAAFAAGALVAWAPKRWRVIAAVAIPAIALIPWLAPPRIDNVAVWKESEVNSEARRAWTAQAADFLAPRYRPGAGVFTTFSDLTGIFPRSAVPLRDTLTWDNWPWWPAAVARPDLFLREEWAICVGGDPVQSAINRAYLRGPRYTLQKIIIVKGAAPVEIYRRDSHRGLTTIGDENSIHEGARSGERLPADLDQ